MLKVDYEELASSAKALETEGNNFEACIGKMEKVVSKLPNIWEADTCDKYVEEFNDSKKTLKAVRKLIQDMSDQMKKISANFAKADADMAKQMKSK